MWPGHAGPDVSAKAESLWQAEDLFVLSFKRHPACLSLDAVLAQPVEEVLTGTVGKALVGRPRSGFDHEKTAEFPHKA